MAAGSHSGLSAAGEWALTRCIGEGLALHKYKPTAAAQYQRCLEDARSLRHSFVNIQSEGRMPAHMHVIEGRRRVASVEGSFDASAQCNVDIEHTRLAT